MSEIFNSGFWDFISLSLGFWDSDPPPFSPSLLICDKIYTQFTQMTEPKTKFHFLSIYLSICKSNDKIITFDDENEVNIFPKFSRLHQMSPKILEVARNDTMHSVPFIFVAFMQKTALAAPFRPKISRNR